MREYKHIIDRLVFEKANVDETIKFLRTQSSLSDISDSIDADWVFEKLKIQLGFHNNDLIKIGEAGHIIRVYGCLFLRVLEPLVDKDAEDVLFEADFFVRITNSDADRNISIDINGENVPGFIGRSWNSLD